MDGDYPMNGLLLKKMKNDMLKPLVSIIVPIYKVEPYLRQCIDSIVNQTYTNLEIILVDDGSPDSCPQICEEYAAKDNRIVVIHKENGGLSDARNAGLDICKGDYISFVDSDDLLDLNSINSMLDLNQDSYMAIANIKTFTGDDKAYVSRKTHCNSNSCKTYSSDDLLSILCKEGPVYLRSVCGKIFKKELFLDIRFPKGELYEDMYVNYLLYYKVNQCTFIPFSLYYYRRNRSGSITSESSNSTSTLEAEEKRYLFLKSHNKPSIAKHSLQSLCWDYLFLYSKKQYGAKDKFLHYSKEYFSSSPTINLHYFCLKFFSICPYIYYIFRKISPWHIRKH